VQHMTEVTCHIILASGVPYPFSLMVSSSMGKGVNILMKADNSQSFVASGGRC
jgi:hypothetical protein